MTRTGTPHVLACIFLLLLHICHATPDNDGPLPETDDYPYHAKLDENYSLQWRFNSTHIMFHTNVKAKGYVGFGVSRNGNMAPGDVVIGWMDGDGDTHFHDRHAKRRLMPEIDQQQDWNLINLKKEHGQYINMTFIRKLNTCDEEEDIPIEAGTTRVIYAYSDSVPFSDDVIPYHGAQTRGTRSLLLLSPTPMDRDATSLPEDVITVDFLLNDYSVPADDTTYACKIFKLPELPGKHHMIRYEPVIQAGHEKIVHHASLFTCSRNISEELVDSVYECYTPEEPEEVRGLTCYRIFLSWAVGGTTQDYPPHVGQSMGAPDDPVYFRLEIHYDNPALKRDYVDNSGFRLYLTKQLRQHDAGMMVVGSLVPELPSIIIPPGVPDFLTRGYATPACLDKVVGEGEIRIIGNGFHTHLLGRRMATRHIRDGQELPPIAKDDYFDFNFQEGKILPEERVIKKGDLLIQDCHYDSSQRTEVTYGGLGTRDEMCLSFLLYYPTTNVKLISSFTTLLYTKNGEPMYPEGVYNFANNANWSDQETLDTFVHNVHTSDVMDICITPNSEDFIPSTQPKVFQEYQPKDVCDPKGDGRVSATSLPLLTIFSAAIASFYTMMTA